MTSGPSSITLRVPATNESIRPATVQAEEWMSEQGVSTDAFFLASLAIEELVTNCIKYGYDDSNEHTIDVVLTVDDGTLRIEVVDDGKAFNPLDAPEPDTSLPMKDRPIGGLGIHLLRELADDATYERRDRMNRLVLMKRMSS
jgi:anti-sigma regulatory factor (Ser/Thr protein kinase)